MWCYNNCDGCVSGEEDDCHEDCEQCQACADCWCDLYNDFCHDLDGEDGEGGSDDEGSEEGSDEEGSEEGSEEEGSEEGSESEAPAPDF